MIRIICSETDAGALAHGAGDLERSHKTFDVELPEVEAWLRESRPHGTDNYLTRQFLGIELLTTPER